MQSPPDTLTLLSLHYTDEGGIDRKTVYDLTYNSVQPTPVTTCENTHVKHIGIGICCVSITSIPRVSFDKSEILVCLFFAFS